MIGRPMNGLERRLTALENRGSLARRRVAIVLAVDEADKERQIAELLSQGLMAASDGLLCITGRPVTGMAAR